MGKKEKLKERLKSNPKDFTFDEMQSVLEYLGFEMSNKGKTSGSRVRFLRGNTAIILHKPHPRKQIIEILEKENLL